jgi:formylglycine-generating enzyme required for sulfatase activity
VQESRLKPKSDGHDRVQRGGSWDFDPQLARVAYRSYDDPGYRGNYLGLRLVRDQEGEWKKAD